MVEILKTFFEKFFSEKKFKFLSEILLSLVLGKVCRILEKFFGHNFLNERISGFVFL